MYLQPGETINPSQREGERHFFCGLGRIISAMKNRSVKLREAHKSNGAATYCSILWDQEADHIVTSSSLDTAISIHNPLLLSSPPRVIRYHRDGVTALAISPNSTCLASGSEDRSVKLYKFPGGEFQTNITRFTLPIRVLSFNKSGSMLAAAGDDDGIKLINAIDGTIARVLKGHKGTITGLAFDPKSEYLASVDSIGTVIIWELQSGTVLHTLEGVAPNTRMDFSIMNVLCWSPDGETLAVPGLKNDVVMYDRDTAEKMFTLRGDHVERVCFLCWSPNGKYMATSGLDKQVLIWDVGKKEDIDRQKFDDVICCMAWKPKGNSLAVIDGMGKYGIWDSPVPSSKKSPTEDIPTLQSRNSNGLLLFDDEDGEDPIMSGRSSDLGEDSFNEFEPPSRKRLRKQSIYDDDDDDLDGEITNKPHLVPKVESRKRAFHGRKEMQEKGDEVQTCKPLPTKSKMQEPFQPGCTPVQPGKKHFLCYNMVGCITRMERDDGIPLIETDFHDTGRGLRVPSMKDQFGFTLAAMNENGSVFANPCKGVEGLSTLMYRPFSSWANNSQWYARFEEEEVKAVALGTDWVAAITSLNFLHIFSEGGLQRMVLSLGGHVVVAAGFKEKLAIVTADKKILKFKVFNMSTRTKTISGRLPLSDDSCLTWFGFSEEGQLCSFDSKGVLRVFTDLYSGSWVPVFRSNKSKKPDENHWVVGLNSSELFCVVCKSPDTFPQVFPKPILNPYKLSIPLPVSDLGADIREKENEIILKDLHLSQTNKRLEEAEASGQDATWLDDEVITTEVALDRCILKLIESCGNGDKLVRATDLAKLMSGQSYIEIAIKLATKLNLPSLAERFYTVLEERLRKESREATTVAPVSYLTTSTNYIAPIQADVLPSKPLVSTESSKAPEAAAPLELQKLSSPNFVKKASSSFKSEKAAAGVEHKKVVKLGDDTNEEPPPTRTLNPFAKSVKKQEKPSLFDSLKKKNDSAAATK